MDDFIIGIIKNASCLYIVATKKLFIHLICSSF